MAERYRSRIPCGRKIGWKKKTGGSRWGRPWDVSMVKSLHVFCGSHLDGVQLQAAPLYGNVMTGMVGHFVLGVDGIDLVVGVIHEHILGAVLLDALDGAIASFGLCPLGTALAVGNPAGHAAVRRHCQSRCKQSRCDDGHKLRFHWFPLLVLLQ